MTSADVLIDAYERVREQVRSAVRGLNQHQLAHRVDPDANSIAWLVWHLTRVQDDHIADAAGSEQLWTADDWVDEFGLPLDPQDTGFGHTSEEVAAVRASAKLLSSYHDAVHDRTAAYVSGLTDDDLDQVIDDSWDPPVTLGVRLVSVIGDGMQHVGQAAFVRGIVHREKR
jgi:uncharacterized damage-inducible protein DinB